MIGKNNKHLKTTKEGTKVESYSIKKFKVGAASVVIGASIFLGAGAVAQASEEVSNDTTTDNTTNAGDKAEGALKAEAKPTVENTKESVVAGVAGKLGAEAPKAEAKLDTAILENYINKISANLESGKYAGKTDESVAVLKAELESAKATLAKATTQKELQTAYNKLVMTVNSKLRNKPVEKKDIPTVDTTNGKETVGKKAGNTEKKSDSNSIENTGSNDLRNGKALDGDNAFRTEAVTNKKPVGNIPFSNAATKDIYVYKGEETNIELSVTDDSGKIKDIRVGEGSRGIDALGAAGSRINNQYGLTFSSQRNETDGIVATQDNPAKVTITGNISVPNNPTYTGKLVTRYLVAEDLDGAVFSEPTGNQENANPLPEGYFKLWVREQTQKYDIQAQTNEAGKIAVADVNNLSQADFEKIKNNIKITYNTADDARLLDKNGKLVENASNYIDTVTKQGDQIVVTYKDGSTDSVALTSVLRNNPLPTVKVPYSNQAEKQVYVYTGENTDLTFTANDDTTVKDMYLRGPGDVNWNNTTDFGFSMGVVNNGVVTGGGTISDNKQEATIKMTGKTNLNAGQQWTSFVVANDNDNFSSMPAGRNFNALDIDPDAKSKPGYIRFVVKDQTSKYDITAPTEKVAVADPDNVTEADLAKIQEKLKLEYSNNNDDANLADKKGKNVDDKDSRIKSVTKDDQGNLVVTYKDGSTDKRKLSEFVSLDKQPAITAVNQAAENKIAEINKTPNATDEEKAAAIAKVNADKEKAVAAINDANVTTKDAIDKAQNAGTTAIAGDNPVVAKKAAAKADVEAARQAKANAINADKNLTQAEKDAALAKVTKAAEDATKAIDAATKDAAVDAAKGTGITELGKVNPIAKENAKEAIGNALTAKNNEIDGRKDLTQAEKDAAKVEAKKLADAELAKVNAQPDNAETAEAAAAAQKLVNDAEDKGVADVTSVYPIAKEQAKKAVADELANKEKELDARKDLTTEEKEAAKKEAQALAKKATDAINGQPAIADTSDKATAAQKAVDTAKDKGVAEVKAVNPEAKVKPAAKKAIEDKLAKQLEDIANTPDATDEEKAEAVKKATDAANKAKEAVDTVTTDAAVKTEKDKAVGEGDTKGTIDQAVPVVEDKPNARKAIDAQTEAKKKELDARTDLSPKAKEVLKAKADKIAKEAKKLVDAATKEADVNKIEEADRSAIRAVGDVNRPVDKVLVKDPSALKDEEKAKILEEVKKVNPTAREVKYNDEGNIEVTTENGDKGIIIPSKLVKTQDDLDNGKGGNDINKPLDKVIVKDPANLTPEEKAKIIAAVEAVNPNAIVTIDENGSVSVSTPEGRTSAIPATYLVRTQEDVAKAGAGNSNIVKPADKVVGEATDPAAQAKVEKKLRALNPEAKSVKFDGKGNATVTLNDGTTATIPAEDLFKSEAQAKEPNAGNDIVKPADKVVVDPAKGVDEAAKKAIEEKVKAVNLGATVVVDDKGNATVTTPEGKTAVIPASDLTKSPEEAAKPNAGNDVNTPADKTVVANPDSLTPEEKKAIEDKVKAVNPGATVVVDDKGNATVTTADGKKTAVIPASALTKTAEAAKLPNAGNDVNTPADKTVVANPDSLTPEEKKAIKDKVKAVNPGATVVVDDKGNATVTTADGKKTAVIPASNLVIPMDKLTDLSAQSGINTPARRTLVANKDSLTPEEIAKIKAAVEEVNPGATVVVDQKGNATVTTKDGKTATIAAEQLIKDAKDVATKNDGENINLDFEKQLVADLDNLTDADKAGAKAKIIAANPEVAEVIFDAKGNATVILKNGKSYTILAKDIFKKSKTESGKDINFPDKVQVVDPTNLTDAEKEAPTNKKLGQRLADTGTTETNTGLAGLGMAILGGLLAARRRKNNKN